MNSTGNITHDWVSLLGSTTIGYFSTHFSSPKTTTEYAYFDGDEADYLCSYQKHSVTFLPVLYSLYFVLGMLGNVLVLWVIVMGVRLHSMTDVCLFNLSLADLLLVGSLPFLAHQERDQWVFGDAMCKLVLGVYYVGYYSGIYFITLMGVDRYLAIVHAVYALRVRTRTYGILASGVVWVAAVLSSFPEVLALEVTAANASDHKTCTRDFNKAEGLPNVAIFKMNVLGFVIPLAILVFCYTRILLTLLRGRRAKRQAVRLVVVVMLAFLFCWAPYNVSLFLYGLHSQGFLMTNCQSTQNLILSLQVTEVLAYTHCCLNPVLYVFVGVKLRRQLFKLLSKSPCVRCGFLKAYLTAASGGSIYSRTSIVSERSMAVREHPHSPSLALSLTHIQVEREPEGEKERLT